MRICLIVDDSAVVRKVARRILEDLEFGVVEAESGERALEVCRAAMPDLVLLDWQMAGMSGVEFIPALKREVGENTMPKVVFCTTENDIAQLAKAMRAGADDYLMKPFDRDIVEAKLLEMGLV
jgi:two-component system chemotaxis response regulator CheY